MTEGETDHQALADWAKTSLKWEEGFWCSVVYVEHTSPLTGEPCNEALRISFGSWIEGQTSDAMHMTGGVSAICTVCGHIGLLNINQQWTQL